MKLLACLRGGNESRADARLRDAETKLASVQQRAERVAGSLTARDRRNHWGETVAAIAHGRREGRA